MAYDVAGVRGLFPGLGDGWISLDPLAGGPVPDSVLRAVATSFRQTAGARTGAGPRGRRCAEIADSARQAIADLVGARPEGVVLGATRAALLAALSESLSSRMSLGTGVVVSRLEDEANLAPWLRIANRYGAHVRWAEVEVDTCELPAWQFAELIGPNARLVAVTAGSAIVGTIPDVRTAADLVHAVGGLAVVDASALAAYRSVDIAELGADVLALDASAWGGPPVGALVFSDPGLLDRIPALSLNPAATGVHRLELGELPSALLGGVSASVDYVAGLSGEARSSWAGASRRERLNTSLTELSRFHVKLFGKLCAGLAALPRTTVLRGTGEALPVASFTIANRTAEDIAQHLARRKIGVLAGQHGGARLLETLGVADAGGAVTVGLNHTTSDWEVDQLLNALSDI